MTRTDEKGLLSENWTVFTDILSAILLLIVFFFIISTISYSISLARVKHLESLVGKVERDREELEELLRKNNLNVNVNNDRIVIRLGEGSLHFTTDSADLALVTESQLSDLYNIGKILKSFLDKNEGANKNLFVVIVEGYTDTQGEDEHNKELSFKRGFSILSFWESKIGLSAANYDIVATGYGEAPEKLAVKTEDEVDNEENRRVEIRIVPKFHKLMMSLTTE